ncbi:O52B2 protein, partial [Atractosteus spatula]|nr:O52B2 protein [Atractosteus spatula]
MENLSDVTIFTLNGLNETRVHKYAFFSITFLFYLGIIFTNLTLFVIILLEKSLHKPMYIFICNLSVNTLYRTAGFYPKLLADFLSETHVISYTGCLCQVFVIYSSVQCEFTTLTVMAYDRYVAICRPLEYYSIMTPVCIGRFLLIMWLVPFCEIIITILWTSRLPLCGSHIDKLYCENWSVVKLSCVDTTLNNVIGYIFIIKYFLQFLFIVYSYIVIIRACLQSREGRSKFMQTCLPHLSTLICFTVTMLFDLMYTRYGSRNTSQTLRNVMAVEFLVIPPLLNPLVYGLNLTHIRRKVWKLCLLCFYYTLSFSLVQKRNTTKLNVSINCMSDYHLQNYVQNIAVFYLNGLNETRSQKYIFFLCTLLFYLLIIILNLTLIAAVLLEKSLHEPMYIFICNLSVNTLYGTAGFYPKLLADFLSDTHVISYTGCFTQVFVIYSSVLCEYSSLTVMAYDRYVAICKPLEYHAIMNTVNSGKIILILWVLLFCESIIPIFLVMRLPLCGSQIDKLYCENWSVIKLSCVDTTLNNIYGYIVIILQVSQAFFIVYSYTKIIRECLKSSEGRSKFVQTCLPHLITLFNFTITTLFDIMYSRYGSRNTPQILRNIMAVEFLVIPPLLNPLVYGLNLTQIRMKVRRLRKRKVDSRTYKVSDGETNLHVLPAPTPCSIREGVMFADELSIISVWETNLHALSTFSMRVFNLNGLNETRLQKYIFFLFTFLFYLLIIFLNLTLIATVLLEKSLHEPMYIFICNLNVNTLYGTAGFYPKLLADFLSDTHVISYTGCLIQAFMIYSSVLCEYSNLTVMAYDRYVAICKPLEYHSIMNTVTAKKIVLILWTVTFCETVIPILLNIRLPLCGSQIDKLYCDNWSMVKLSCVDTTLNNICGYILVIACVSQAFFIVYSYIQIIRVCVISSEGRSKFMQTCLPHLISLITFSITTVFDVMFSRYGSRNTPQTLRNIMAVEFLVIPPLLNPLIYGLNLTQIRIRVKRWCNNNRH